MFMKTLQFCLNLGTLDWRMSFESGGWKIYFFIENIDNKSVNNLKTTSSSVWCLWMPYNFVLKSGDTISLVTFRPLYYSTLCYLTSSLLDAGEPGYPRLPGAVDHQRRPVGTGQRHPFPVGGERRPHHTEGHLRGHGSVHLHGHRGRGLRLRPHLPLPPGSWAKPSSTLEWLERKILWDLSARSEIFVDIGVPWAKSFSRFECPEQNLLWHWSALSESFFEIRRVPGMKSSSTLEYLEGKLLWDLSARNEIFCDIGVHWAKDSSRFVEYPERNLLWQLDAIGWQWLCAFMDFRKAAFVFPLVV